MVKSLKRFATIFTGSLFAILVMILISAGTTSVRADELQKNGLVHEADAWNYYVNGKIASGTTTLVKYNGTWWYVRDGKIDFTSRTLVKYNGIWWFVENGKINWNAATVVHYGNTWYYVKGGQVHWNDSGLCKYNGQWWYIKHGNIDFTSRTLVKYNGIWWFVENGKINWNGETVVKYNGIWFYVKNGQVNWNSGETLCKYNYFWWYVKNGKIDFKSTTLCKYNGTWWYVRGGHVDFGNHVNSAKVKEERNEMDEDMKNKGYNLMGGPSAYDGTNETVDDGKPATGSMRYYHFDINKQKYVDDGYVKSKGYSYDPNEFIEVGNTSVRVSDSDIDLGNYVQHSDLVGDNASNYTLCYYNGYWWVIKNGKAVISDPSFPDNMIVYVRYGSTLYYTKNGRVDFSVTEDYMGINGFYHFINGVCPIEKWMGNVLI